MDVKCKGCAAILENMKLWEGPQPYFECIACTERKRKEDLLRKAGLPHEPKKVAISKEQRNAVR